MAVDNETKDTEHKSRNHTGFLQKASNYKKLFLFLILVSIILTLAVHTNFFTKPVMGIWRRSLNSNIITSQQPPPSVSIVHYSVNNGTTSLTQGHLRNCIVHYIVDGNNFKFNVHNFISVLSAIRFLKPKQIMFHAVVWPWEESYWCRVIRQVSPRVVFQNATDNITPFKFAGTNLNGSFTSLIKLSILKNYGGIILTLDTVLLGSISQHVEELFELSGNDTSYYISSDSLMFSNKNSTFVSEWYNAVIEAPSESALIKSLQEYPIELAKNKTSFSIEEVELRSLMQNIRPFNSLEFASARGTSVGDMLRYILYNQTMHSRNNRFVPRLVHFFWDKTSTKDLSFLEFMSIKSAYRFYKPRTIFFYITPEARSPVGAYWSTTVQLEQFEVVNLRSGEHTRQSMDDLKVHILEVKGGIFLNLCVIAMNDIEFLRGFDGVVSFDGKQYGREFIMMKPGYNYRLIIEKLLRFSATTEPLESVFTMSDTVCWQEGFCQVNSKESLTVEPSTAYDIDSLFYIKFNADIVNSYNTNTIQRLNSTFGQAVRLSLNGFSDVVTPHLFVVPNIIHYVWFGQNRTFSVVNVISVYSAYIMQSPDRIYFHHDALPIGPWWDKVQRVVPIIEMVKTVAPDSINGKPIKEFIEHKTDVARLEILMKYGGMYIDSDVFVLRSINPLRMHPYTLAKESAHNGLANCIILASSDSEFLHMFYESYRTDYKDSSWAYNSIIVPFRLSITARPDKISIGPSNRMVEPGWENCPFLFGTNSYVYWKDNYTLHLFQKRCADKRKMRFWETAMYDHPYNNSLVGRISQYFYENFQKDFAISQR